MELMQKMLPKIRTPRVITTSQQRVTRLSLSTLTSLSSMSHSARESILLEPLIPTTNSGLHMMAGSVTISASSVCRRPSSEESKTASASTEKSTRRSPTSSHACALISTSSAILATSELIQATALKLITSSPKNRKLQSFSRDRMTNALSTATMKFLRVTVRSQATSAQEESTSHHTGTTATLVGTSRESSPSRDSSSLPFFQQSATSDGPSSKQFCFSLQFQTQVTSRTRLAATSRRQ